MLVLFAVALGVDEDGGDKGGSGCGVWAGGVRKKKKKTMEMIIRHTCSSLLRLHGRYEPRQRARSMLTLRSKSIDLFSSPYVACVASESTAKPPECVTLGESLDTIKAELPEAVVYGCVTWSPQYPLL